MKMVISIGSNLAEPIAEVEKAITALRQRFEVVSQSSLYRTAPVGGPDQPDYINAVVIISADQQPEEVLAVLHEIELTAGRVRDVRWGPRILDLDLIDAEGTVSDHSECMLPHPRAHQRAFVLLPWLEADPDAELTGMGKVRDMAIPDQAVARI